MRHVDLLNSLVVASVAVMIIGTKMFGSDGVSLPLWLVTAGMTASLLSLSLTAIIVHVFGGNAGREKLLWLLRVGYYSASLLFLVFAYFITSLLHFDHEVR